MNVLGRKQLGRVVAIVQARIGSTRLPGKILLDILGKPMLYRVVERSRRARLLDATIVATTDKPSDDLIEELCAANGWSCFRGSEADVLDRYFRAAQAFEAEVVVRITSDCPLIDPALIDKIVQAYSDAEGEMDYVTNTIRPTSFPRGLDVEVVRFSALERAWQDDKNVEWREHVTLYIKRHPELFRSKSVSNGQDYSWMRWTVDTPEDLEFVRRIYAHFGHDRFSWGDVVLALEQHPEWLATNRHVQQKAEPI